MRSSGRSLGRKSTWRKLACLPLSPLPSLSLSLALTAPPPTPYPIACVSCGGGSDEDGPTALRHAEARIVRGCRPLRLRLRLRIPAVGTADQFALENALWRANTAEAAWPAGRRGPVGRRRVTGYDAERSGAERLQRACSRQSGRRTLVALPSSRHSRSALPCSSDCEGDAESFSLQHSRPPPLNAPTESANAPVSAALVCCHCGTEWPHAKQDEAECGFVCNRAMRGSRRAAGPTGSRCVPLGRRRLRKRRRRRGTRADGLRLLHSAMHT